MTRVQTLGTASATPERPSPARARGVVRLDDSPDVQVLGDAVVIRGRAVLDGYRILAEGVRAVRVRDAIEAPEHIRQLLAGFKLAGERAAAQPDTSDISDVRDRPRPRPLRTGELIGIAEVARMCGVGDRQARRLAESLGGTKPRGVWIFDRGLVNAYLNQITPDRNEDDQP